MSNKLGTQPDMQQYSPKFIARLRKGRARGGNGWTSDKRRKPGAPNTSIILNNNELEYIGRYFGGKSEAIHAALGAMMSTVESIRSEYGPEVARIAAIAGATGIEELGDGGEGEMHCTFFALHTPTGLIRGATTNAAPVWEDEDAEVFANLAEACGVAL